MNVVASTSDSSIQSPFNSAATCTLLDYRRFKNTLMIRMVLNSVVEAVTYFHYAYSFIMRTVFEGTLHQNDQTRLKESIPQKTRDTSDYS